MDSPQDVVKSILVRSGGYSRLAYGFLGLFVLAVLGAVAMLSYQDRADF
jgi:hypothetical protein